MKGLTILLVVFHHAQEGVHTSLGMSDQFHYFYEILSPIRMPLFFLVAGLFASRSIQGPLGRFLDTKVVHFLYFYLLWSCIIFLFRFSMNGITNNKTELTEILKILWDPLPTIWFLYALLISFIILRLARNISPAYIISFAAIVQATALFNGSAWTGIVIVDKLSVIFVYFAIGVFAADWIKGFARDITPLRPPLKMPLSPAA